MSEELLPCPFCGNEAQVIDDLVTFHAKCQHCGATGAVSSYDHGAATAWNRRAAVEAAVAAERGRWVQLVTRMRDVFVDVDFDHWPEMLADQAWCLSECERLLPNTAMLTASQKEQNPQKRHACDDPLCAVCGNPLIPRD